MTLLGEYWTIFDNVSEYMTCLVEELDLGSPSNDGICIERDMMTPDEIMTYESLPDHVPVYRGCYGNNKWGLCWSLSRQVAETFPMLDRYRQKGQPILVTAQAKKTNIVAVKLDRGESEIVTLRPKHISTEHIRQLHLANA